MRKGSSLNSNIDPVVVFAERFEAFYNATNDAIAILTAEGEILDANPQLVKLSEYSFDSLVSKDIQQLLPKETIPSFEAYADKMINGSRRKEPLHIQLIDKSRRIHEFEISLSLLKNQYGHEKTLLAVMHNVTKQVEQKQKIQSHAEELERVFDAVHTVLFVIDDKKHIRQVNRSGIMLIDKNPRDILGKRVGEVLDCIKHYESPKGCGFGSWCRDCAIREGILRCIKAGETVINAEESLVRNDIHHSPTFFRMNIVPFAVNGKHWGVISLEDITESKRTEMETERLSNSITRSNVELKRTLEKFAQSQSQLLEAQKMEQVGLLASGFAHNLRAPLAGIKGYTELLSMDYPDLEELEMVLKEVQAMEDIIANLLKKNRKDHQRSEEIINLNDLVQTELKFLKANMFFRHQVTTQTDLDPELPSIKGIYTHFSQAIVNMIQNSLDAMHLSKKRELTIRTEHDNKHLYVHISDSGCGIPEEIKAKIFNVFFTTKPGAEDRIKNEPIGTGLGLASANHFIRQYGGKINLKSKEGEGTTFTLQIPYSQKNESEEIPTVLIVDDEDSMVNVLVRISQDQGYTTYGTTDGYEALKLYEKINPTLIISDLVMPGLTGAEMMSKIREINPGQKVIYISGYSDNPDFRNWLKKEMQHPAISTILKKPFRMEGFVKVLQRMLASSEQELLSVSS